MNEKLDRENMGRFFETYLNETNAMMAERYAESSENVIRAEYHEASYGPVLGRIGEMLDIWQRFVKYNKDVSSFMIARKGIAVILANPAKDRALAVDGSGVLYPLKKKDNGWDIESGYFYIANGLWHPAIKLIEMPSGLRGFSGLVKSKFGEDNVAAMEPIASELSARSQNSFAASIEAMGEAGNEGVPMSFFKPREYFDLAVEAFYR
jgi:hypothetical protein